MVTLYEEHTSMFANRHFEDQVYSVKGLHQLLWLNSVWNGIFFVSTYLLYVVTCRSWRYWTLAVPRVFNLQPWNVVFTN